MRSWRGGVVRPLPPRCSAVRRPMLPRGVGEGARQRRGGGGKLPPGPIMVGWPAMKPASALRLLHWAVLAFVLIGARARPGRRTRIRSISTRRARRSAPPKRRSGTRTSPTPICRPSRPRTTRSASPLQGAIADLTPRLAASTKRLAELTPKSGETAPTTDVAAKELESEKKRHDTLDANLRAARAMLLQADDLSTRISAARRQLFARQTFARSSSVLDPQLWAAVWREVPIDAEVMRSLIGNWLDAVGERLSLAAKIGIAAVALALALAVAPLCVAHPPGRLSRSRRERPEPAPPRARRRVDLLHPGGAAARRPRPAGERARRLRPFRSERPGPHRRGA